MLFQPCRTQVLFYSFSCWKIMVDLAKTTSDSPASTQWKRAHCAILCRSIALRTLTSLLLATSSPGATTAGLLVGVTRNRKRDSSCGMQHVLVDLGPSHPGTITRWGHHVLSSQAFPTFRTSLLHYKKCKQEDNFAEKATTCVPGRRTWVVDLPYS